MVAGWSMTPDLVLCIDDEPDRYRRLVPLVGTVLVTDCPETFEFWLALYRPRILGVCLDHDMRHKPGTWFARRLGEFSIPVAITSMNPIGADDIADILDECGVRRIMTPALLGGGWEQVAVRFFGGSDVTDALCGECGGAGLLRHSRLVCMACGGNGRRLEAQ